MLNLHNQVTFCWKCFQTFYWKSTSKRFFLNHYRKLNVYIIYIREFLSVFCMAKDLYVHICTYAFNFNPMFIERVFIFQYHIQIRFMFNVVEHELCVWLAAIYIFDWWDFIFKLYDKKKPFIIFRVLETIWLCSGWNKQNLKMWISTF